MNVSILRTRGQLDRIAPGAGPGPPNWRHFHSGISWGSGKRLLFTCSWEVGFYFYLLHLPSVPCVSPTVRSTALHPTWAQISCRSSREPWQVVLQTRRATTPLCCSLGLAMKAKATLDKIYFLASAQIYHSSLSYQWQCQTCALHLTWCDCFSWKSEKKWEEGVIVTPCFQVLQLWQSSWSSIFQLHHLSSSKRLGKTTFPSWDLQHCVLLADVFPRHAWLYGELVSGAEPLPAGVRWGCTSFPGTQWRMTKCKPPGESWWVGEWLDKSV